MQTNIRVRALWNNSFDTHTQRAHSTHVPFLIFIRDLVRARARVRSVETPPLSPIQPIQFDVLAAAEIRIAASFRFVVCVSEIATDQMNLSLIVALRCVARSSVTITLLFVRDVLAHLRRQTCRNPLFLIEEIIIKLSFDYCYCHQCADRCDCRVTLRASAIDAGRPSVLCMRSGNVRGRLWRRRQRQ